MSSERKRRGRNATLELSSDERAFMPFDADPAEHIDELSEYAAALVKMSVDQTDHFWLPSITTRGFNAAQIERVVRAGYPRSRNAQREPPDFFSFAPNEEWVASSLGFLRVVNGRIIETLKYTISSEGNLVDTDTRDVILAPNSTGATTLEHVYAIFAGLLAEFAESRLALTHAVNGKGRADLERVIKSLAAAKRALQSPHARLVTYRLGAGAVIAVNDGYARYLDALLKQVDARRPTGTIAQFMATLEAAYVLLFGRPPALSSSGKNSPYSRFAAAFLECAGCPEPESTVLSRLATKPLRK